MKKYLLLILSGVIAFSCQEDLLEENQPHQLTADNVTKDYNGFLSLIYALNTEVRRERGGGSLFLPDESQHPFNDLAMIPTDNTARIATWGPGSGFGANLNNLTTLEPAIQNTWEYFYNIVMAANLVISRGQNADIDWTEEQKSEILGEASLMRAHAYRHLSYLWGPVPLITEESGSNPIRVNWDRAPLSEIYDRMEADLLFAIDNMSTTPKSQGRPSAAVARHYLAELYLRMDRPADAVTQAQAVIDLPEYSLVTSRFGVNATNPGTAYSDLFLDGNHENSEALWNFVYDENYNSFQQDDLATRYVNGGTLGGRGPNIMARMYVSRIERIDPGYFIHVAGPEADGGTGGRGIQRNGITAFALNLYDHNSDGTIGGSLNGATQTFTVLEDDRASEYIVRRWWPFNNPGVSSYTDLNGITYSFGDRVPTSDADMPEVAIEEEDPRTRMRNWPSTRKWDFADPFGTANPEYSFKDQPYIRLAETYLLLAEAQLENGDPGAAETTLNVLRDRANAPTIAASGDSPVDIDVILDERSRELFSEEHRRYALVRTGKFLERVRAHNNITGSTVEDHHVLWPLPQDFLDANFNNPDIQNPGY